MEITALINPMAPSKDFAPNKLETQQLQPHPLLMDHIVENVLLSMDADLLGHYCKIFRLVCKDWSQTATRVYKTKRGRIVFKRNFVGKVSGLFIRVMKTSPNIPFQNFKFCSDSYDDEYFSELFHVCGEAISTLDLNIVNPCNLKFPKMFETLILGKLRRLVFHVRLDCFEVIQTDISSLLETLFKISPNLESLDLQILRGISRVANAQNTQLSLQALTNFGDILATQLPDGIRELKLHITLNDSQLRELNKRKLNLRRLDVYFQQSEVSTEALEEFFAACGNNLISCKVLGNQFVKQKVKLPVFKKLEYLSALARAPDYVQYQKLFPVLHQLEICLWDSFDDIFPPNCYSPTLAHVKFPYHVGSPSIFHRMGRCFPHLKKLTDVTITTSEAMISIFQYLKTLEVLDFSFGYDFQTSVSLDALFSGMNYNFPLVKYNEELIRQEISRNGNDRDSIRNLKELRYLSILAAPLTMASTAKFTDMSVYYGLLQLDKLSVVRLDFFPISIPCLEVLRKSVNLLRPV